MLTYECPKCGWTIKSPFDETGKECANCDGIVEPKAAEQKMHPTLGESSASDSESKPAPKQVI